MLDQVFARRRDRRGARPRRLVVAASILVAIGLWFVIFAVTGRAVLFW